MNILYPGSFDPITKGHIYLIKKILKLFPDANLHIVVMNNEKKKHHFDIVDREEMVNLVFNKKNVSITSSSESLDVVIDKLGIDLVVRGLRNGTDFEYELNIEQYTKSTTKAGTIYISVDEKNVFTSSSLVRAFLENNFKCSKKYLHKKVYHYLKKQREERDDEMF